MKKQYTKGKVALTRFCLCASQKKKSETSKSNLGHVLGGANAKHEKIGARQILS